MRQILNLLYRWLSLVKSKVEINYPFYLFFWVLLSLLTFSYFLFPKRADAPPLFYFIPYVLIQSLFEVASFMTIGYLLKRWAPGWLFKVFIGTTFFALLGHYTDFVLLRVLDSSFSYLLKFFFGSGVDHLFAAFIALNFDLKMVGLIAAALIAVPGMGIGFYYLTQKWADKKPWRLSFSSLIGSIIYFAALLLLLDLFAAPFLTRMAYNKYQKGLLMGGALIPPDPVCQKLPHPLPPPRNEKEVEAEIGKIEPVQSPLPNIYFFIIETFRKDYVTKEIAPHLNNFRKNHPLQPTETFSNSNCTYLSWFALLHSNLPFYWNTTRDEWTGGSAPLRALKKLGYKIKVYSSADFNYFNMDKVLFGQNLQLVDQIENTHSEGPLEAHLRDRFTMNRFFEDLGEGKEGVVYLFFLDSTHSDYSFPKQKAPFAPYCEEISYLTITPDDPSLELLKNRYKNAVHYVDSLVGEFFTVLQNRGLYEEAIIAITGDHGEEFFEEGALFHGTHLNSYQTSVPLFCKFPAQLPFSQTPSTHMTHIDILPSILHCLSGKSDLSLLFDGESIFLPKRSPYQIAITQNGANTPLEFRIENGSMSLSARFLEEKGVFENGQIEILNSSGKPLSECLDLFDLSPPLPPR